MALLEHLRVPSEPASVTVARYWVRDQVSAAQLPPGLVRDLELLTSEMVTAAVKAGDGSIALRVTVDDFAIRVDVTDEHGNDTQQFEDRALDVLVDGIDVVHAVSAEWDWRTNADGGKTVWALLIRDI